MKLTVEQARELARAMGVLVKARALEPTTALGIGLLAAAAAIAYPSAAPILDYVTTAGIIAGIIMPERGCNGDKK